MFGVVKQIHRLEVNDIDKAERSLTRLTAANASALTIIRLLRIMQGVAFETTVDSSRTPGFLFDMNHFFQRLLSRFLRENLTDRRIMDERAIGDVFAYSRGANPKGRRAPKPRPDYALFHANKVAFIDAKYRDIWEKGLPAEWLYQLSIYALGSPFHVSVLLYATMAREARDEQIEIRQPVVWSISGPAYVILRPVLLPRLAELLHPPQNPGLAPVRRHFADDLVNLGVRAPAVGGRSVDVQATRM